MLIAQKIDNLLNGVSQRPVEQRHSSQAEAQVNGLSSAARGLMKRPPLVHRGSLALWAGYGPGDMLSLDSGDQLQLDSGDQLSLDTPGSLLVGGNDAFVHTVNRDEAERYHVIIADDIIQVFDALTGLAVPVLDRTNGMAYLNDDDGSGFRAATAGDTTVIVNRGVSPARGDTKTDSERNEALLYVRQADYGTTYQVTLNGTTVGIETLPGSTAVDRADISTDAIATDLVTALTAEALLAAFVFTRIGSTIHVVRADSADFTLSVSDGLADQGLKAVKKSVQAFADLPRRAPNGFTVGITGDPESDLDNYWVRFDDEGHPENEGVWREAPQPGTIINLDPATMPHQLVRYGNVLGKVEHVALLEAADAAVLSLGSETLVQTTQPWTSTVLVGGDGAVIKPLKLETFYGGAGGSLILAANARNIQVTINVNAAYAPVGTDMYGVLYINAVEVARTPAVPAASNQSFDLTVSGTFLATDVLKALEESGQIAPSPAHTGVTFNNPVFTAPSEAYRGVWFNRPLYPVGTVLTVTVDGIPFTYSVTIVPKSGLEVAAAFAALIDAHASFIAVVGEPDSVVKVRNTTGTFPVILVALDLSESTIFYNPDLDLVGGSLVGLTLRNLSDNSQGTILSNSDDTITVNGLTGGVDNTFSSGDTIVVEGAGRYFIFEPCPWKDRGAGDLTIVPFPSFIDQTISDVFFYSNRLGFTSNENVIMSSSGDLYNLFRYSASELTADDVIDVRSSHAEVSLFHTAVLWNKGLYLISNNGEWQVSGEPALTPQTVRIDAVSRIFNTPDARPVVAGNKLYLTRGKSGFVQVYQFYITADTTGKDTVVEAIDITKDSPKYIKGNPIAMAGDDTFLAILTDDDPQVLYVYSYAFDEQGRLLQSSWSTWQFESLDILALDVIDGKLGMLVKDATGTYFGDIDLNVMLDADTTDEGATYLDRRLNGAVLTPVYSGGNTTWTLPYPVAIDGSEGEVVVVERNPVAELTVTRPTPTTVRIVGADKSAASVYVGIRYAFRYTPTRIFYRKPTGAPETRGRTMLRYVDVFYNDSTDFDVVVTLAGRNARTYSYHSQMPDSGSLRVPIQGRNTYTLIELVNDSTGACAFSLLDWEGDFTIRDRRV